jgi:hypothetical protein
MSAMRLAGHSRRLEVTTVPGDTVDRMIDDVLRARGEDEPLDVTATRIFLLGADGLSDSERTALEAVGFEAVRSEGPPAGIEVPSVVRMIEMGRPFDHVGIDPEERPRVMLLGFLALVAEQGAEED